MLADYPKIISTFLLFVATALSEIVGCYLPYLILKQGKTAWLWLPTLCSLAIFVWLLTLHPTATGRVYASYGGIYIVMALCWLRWVDGMTLTAWDWLGGLIVLFGASVIILQPNGFR